MAWHGLACHSHAMPPSMMPCGVWTSTHQYINQPGSHANVCNVRCWLSSCQHGEDSCRREQAQMATVDQSLAPCNPVVLPSCLTVGAVSVHHSKQRLVSCDVFLKGKAVVLIGLLVMWLTPSLAHARNLHGHSLLVNLQCSKALRGCTLPQATKVTYRSPVATFLLSALYHISLST